MRYLPHTEKDREKICADIGINNAQDLFHVIPEHIRKKAVLNLPPAKSELAVERYMQNIAKKNIAADDVSFFLGAGAYKHHIPASVDMIIQRSEFLTAYTPYQPEIAQGTLQYLFEFQTQCSRLMGMEMANASMYDGSTASAEAVLAAFRITRKNKAIISGNIHPQYRDVITNLCTVSGYKTQTLPPRFMNDEELLEVFDDDTAAIIVQNPDFFGHVNDFSTLAKIAHEKNALLIVCTTECVSLGLIKTPGEMGADIAVAEGQSIGNSLNFGGPYLGLYTTKKKYMRQTPGRLCGKTVDSDGKTSYVLTLTAREQHIRREKATSNICTNSGLCTLAFSAHMSLLGQKGLHTLARINHAKAQKMYKSLSQIPKVTIYNSTFFNEFTIQLPANAADIVDRLLEDNIIAGLPVSRLIPDNPECNNLLLVCATEMTTDNDIAFFANKLQNIL